MQNASLSTATFSPSLRLVISLLSSVVWIVLWANMPVIAQTWQVVPAASTVNFTIKNAGITVNGSFSLVAATIVFDPNQLETAQIMATLPTRTLKTGIRARDKHLRGKNYFDTAHYPTITFASTSVSRREEGFVARGLLTIKDVTKPIAIPFTFTMQEDQGIFQANFTLNRLDYQVGSPSWILADDVKVAIVVRAVKESP